MNRKEIVCLAASCVLLTGCETLFPLQRTGRTDVQVIPPKDTEAPLPGYLEEHSAEAPYIAARRVAAHVDRDAPLLGVAFSGGGVRSATFNLGVLQGLEEGGLLKNVDYMSCVSGGGYIGGWYASHLRNQGELDQLRRELSSSMTPDEVKATLSQNFSKSRAQLLDLSIRQECKAVYQLREQSGLLGKDGRIAINSGKSILFLTATFIPNLVQDAVIHLQPAPGKWNVFHPIGQYQGLLQDYYLKGWAKVEKWKPAIPGFRASKYHGPAMAEDINNAGSETPLLISCAALSNSGKGNGNHMFPGQPQKDVDGRSIFWDNRNHFELTRFWCGSPILGWIPTEHFGRTVADVKRAGPDTRSQLLRGPVPGYTTSPLTVGTAMAASGAAFDSAGLPRRYRPLANSLLTGLNLNLRYQTANFAQDHTAWYSRPLDRLRETTTDRFSRTPRSNVLQLSDGGHFENLGVFALIRRGVPNILAFDATQDPGYKYGDLKNLLGLIEECGGTYEISPGKVHKGGEPLPSQFLGEKTPADPIWTFKVRTAAGKTCIVRYVKSSYRGETDWKSKFAQTEPKLIALNPATRPGEKLPGDELKKDSYPHISTTALWGWEQPRFDAYRDLGRLLAREVSSEYAGKRPKR